MFGTSIGSYAGKCRIEGRKLPMIDLKRPLDPFVLIPNTSQHLTASASIHGLGEGVCVHSNPSRIINLVIASCRLVGKLTVKSVTRGVT